MFILAIPSLNVSTMIDGILGFHIIHGLSHLTNTPIDKVKINNIIERFYLRGDKRGSDYIIYDFIKP